MAENTDFNTDFKNPIIDVQGVSSPGFSVQEHNDITDALRFASMEIDPNSKIDPSTIRFMENQANEINTNFNLYPTRFDSPRPGNVSDNRNPFANQTGMVDLSTSQGRKDFLGSVGQEVNEKWGGKPHGGQWQSPIVYGMKQRNLDRYMNHSAFKDLGFHPYMDNETYYNQNSTWTDDLSRTSTAFVQMFKPAFTSGWRAIDDFMSGRGFQTDHIGAEAMRDSMRIAGSSRGGTKGFFNDLYLNSAYTFGILSSMFVEEAMLSLGGPLAKGLSNGVRAERKAGQMKRAFDLYDGIGQWGRNAGNYSWDFMKSMAGKENLKKFYQFARGNSWGARNARWLVTSLTPETTRALQTINSTKNSAKNLSNLAKLNTTFGGMYRDVRMFNVAWAESKMEGGLVEIENIEKYYKKAVEKYGEGNIPDYVWEEIREASKAGGLVTSLINFPIIFLTNRLVFDTALRGFKPLGRLLQETQGSAAKGVMRTVKAGVTKSGQEAFKNVGSGLKRLYKEGVLNGAKAMGGFALKYTAKNLAEGFQELAQEATSAGVSHYYTGLYDQIMADGMHMNQAELEMRKASVDRSFASKLKSVRAGLTSPGFSFHTFMSGFLMGGIVQPFQTMMFEHMPNAYRRISDPKAYKKYAQKKKEYIEESVKTLNKMWENPANYFDITKLNALNQRELNQFMLLSNYNNDIKEFIDVKDQAVFHDIFTMLELNKSGDYKAHIQALLELNDVELVDAFSATEGTAKEIRKRFNGIVEKIDKIQDNYNRFNDKYISPFNSDDYEEGTKIWAQEKIREVAFRHAKMMFLFTKDTYDNAVERMNSIINNLSIDPVVDKIAANDISALTSRKNLLAEMQILKDETAVAPAKNASKELKEQHKNKKEKLSILEEFYNVLYTADEKTGYYKKSGTTTVKKKNDKGEVEDVKVPVYSDKMTVKGKAKLREVFMKYLKHIAKVSDGQIQDKDGVDKALEMIVDHKALKGRAADYWQAYQILDDPKVLNDVAERSAEAMNKIWKENKKQFNIYKRLEYFTDNQERAKIISDLARRGIYADPQEAEIFIKTGVKPKAFYTDQSRLNALTAEEDPKAWKALTNVFVAYKKQKEAEEQVKDNKVSDEINVTQEEAEKGSLTAGDEAVEIQGAVDTQEKEVDYSVNPNQKGRPVTSAMYENFVAQEPGTEKILRRLYKQYEYDVNVLKRKDVVKGENNQPLGFSAWVNHSEGGMNMTVLRYQAFTTWTMQGRKGTFEQFLKDNSDLEWLQTLVQKKGYKVQDILQETVFNENKSVEYGIEGDDKVIPTEGYDNAKIKLVKRTTYNTKTDKENITYQVLTLDNENTYDKYQGLPKAQDKLQETYTGENAETDAMAAMDWLRYNIPNQESFDFVTENNKDPETFTTGETVVNQGKKYIVKSKGHNVDRKGNLWVQPLDGGKNIFIPKGKFYTYMGGFTRASEEKLNLQGERKTKLPILEPVQIFPYDPLMAADKEGDKEYKKTLLENMQDELQKLPASQRDLIEVRIELNPEFADKVTNIKPEKRDPKKPFGTFPKNPQLRTGAAKYNVVLYLKKKPFAILSSPYSTTLLDKNNKEIDPLVITKKQAAELFLGAEASTDAYLQIRRNYAAAFEIEEILKNALDEADGENAVITIADLKDKGVDLLVGNGKIAYFDEQGRPGSSKLEELKDNGYTLMEGVGTDGSPLFLVEDQRTTTNKDGFKKESIPIHNFPLTTKKEREAFKNIRKRIKESMSRQGFDVRSKMGRYVTYVFSPGIGSNGGEFTAIELKTEQKSVESLQELVANIKDQMSRTKSENIKDDVTKNPGYNWDFNDKEIREKIFIAGFPGQQFDLTITEFGNLRFKYNNPNFDTDWGKTGTVDYTPEDLNTITAGTEGTINVVGLFKTIQQDINKQIENDKKLTNKNAKGLKLSLVPKSSLNNIRESLPPVLSSNYQQINQKTNAVIEPYIRRKIRTAFTFGDPNKIQNRIQTAIDSAVENRSKKFETEPTEDSTANISIEGKDNTQYFVQLAKDDFKNVPKSILQDIAVKLEENDNDPSKLTKRERAIAESAIPSSEIQEMIIEIKNNKTSDKTQKKVDNSEKQEELKDEQSLTEELENLEQKIYLERMSIRSFETLEGGATNPDYIADEADRVQKSMSDVKLDPEVIDLKTKIDKISRTNWKILSTEFDGRDIETLNVFDEFLNKSLPEWISREEISEFIESAKNKGITAGAFLMNMKTIAHGITFTGTIYTSESSPFKYHEAFHAVFRLLLNDNQISKFLKIGKKGKLQQLRNEKKSLETALEELRVQSPTYSEMTTEQLKEVLWEEWLADQFDAFKMDPKKSIAPSEVKSWFAKIIEWIMSIFEKTNSQIIEEDSISIDPELSRLFRDIDSGKFKSAATYTENRFTERVKQNGGVSTPAWAIIPQDIQIQEYQIRQAGDLITKKRKIVIPFPADEVDMFIKQAAGTYVTIKDDPKYGYGERTKSELIRESVKLITDMYGPQNKQLQQKHKDNYKKLKELENRYTALVKFQKDFISAVREFVNIVDKVNDVFEDEFDVAEQEESATSYNVNEKRNQLGGITSVNEKIRMFMLSTLKDVQDEYGNAIVNPNSPAGQQIPLRASVDYITVFNGLLKALSGKMSQAEQLKKMYIFSQSNGETKAVVDRFFEEFFGSTGPKDMERFITGETGMPPIIKGKKNFFIQVMKAFKQFRVDYIVGLKDAKFGNTDLIAANKQDDEHWQLSKWYAEYDRLLNRIEEDVAKGTIDSNILDMISELQSRMQGDKMSDKELKEAGIDYSNKFRKLLGINLSPLFIQYSILKSLNSGAVGEYQVGLLNGFKGVRPITLKDESNRSDLQELYDALVSQQPLYNQQDNHDFNEGGTKDKTSNYSEQTGSMPPGVFYRLQKWAISNAQFDETVGSTIMLDPKGNYIYSHQTPTYHLEMAERINSIEGIEKLKEEFPELIENILFTDPKFLALAGANKLRILRMLGTRTTSFVKTQDGRKVENKSLDANVLPGKTYGEFSPQEMVANIVNMYALHFNDVSGKLNIEAFKNQKGKSLPFAYAPILIRVLSESNIADYQNMPVLKVLEGMNDDGTFKYSKEYMSKWINLIKEQYNRIKEQTSQLIDNNKGSKIHKGYNDAASIEQVIERDDNPKIDRAYKFNFEVSELLTIIKTFDKIVELDETSFKGKTGRLTDQEISNLDEGSQKVFLKKSGIKGLTSKVGNQGTVYINEVEYVVTHQGLITRNMLTDEQQITLKDNLGKNIIQKDYSEKAGFKYEFTIAGEKYYSKVKQIAEFFQQGDKTLHRIKIVDTATAKQEVKDETIDDPIYNNDLLKYLQNKAREGVDFDVAMKDYKSINGLGSEDFITSALNSQFDRFNEMLSKSKAIDLVDKRIKNGFTEYDDGTRFLDKKRNARAKNAQELLHLTDNSDHNLRQIFFSNWQNTTLLNKFYLGNQAISLKDAIDAIKRAKAQNAGHISADTVVNAPEYGIDNPVQDFGALVLSDPILNKLFDVEGRSQKPGERTDGQIYFTTKAFKHFWFGFGKYNDVIDSLMKKIERGEKVSAEEFFGQVGEDSLGFKQQKAWINSKKMVYMDGEVYLKFSGLVLSKNLDSHDDGSPLEHRKPLYNLRVAMEEYENRTGTFMIAVPESASKMRKTNVLSPDMTQRLFDGELTIAEEEIGPNGEVMMTKDGTELLNSIETLDAHWMRLQQVSPSNKMIIVDPRQIKNIILSEQDDSETVIYMDKEISIGEIRDMYEFSVSNRLELNYLNRSSLIFNIPNAFDALEKSIALNEATPDLEAFLDYAMAALETSQSSTQMMEFFTKKDRDSKYELNNPITIQKYTELIMSFFSKGIMAEKQPGKAVTLISDFGFNVVKRVDAIDEEGTPIAWTVIRTDDWKAKSKIERQKNFISSPFIDNNEFLADEKTLNPKFGQFKNMEVGQIYTDRLRHDVIEYKRNDKGKLIRDKKGNLIEGDLYSEFILPPHFIEEMNLKPGDPIPNVIAKQFAVRIPSQDKHSSVNLKLVDHLPVEYGSSGVFAQELIEISGWDFDIDKVYIHHKEFYEKNGKLIEYGKAKTLKDQYDEYIMNSEKETFTEGTSLFYAYKKWKNRRRRDDSEIEKTARDIEEEFTQWILTSPEGLLFQGEKDTRSAKAEFAREMRAKTGKQYRYNYSSDTFQPLYKELETKEKRIKATKGALSILGLPVTKSDYKKFREDNKKIFKTEDGKEITLYREPYAAAYSNNILDFKYAMLGNAAIAKPRGGRNVAIKNEPATDEAFSKYWDLWNKPYEEGGIPALYERNRVDRGFDPNNPLGQWKFFKDSKEGSRNISAVVPANTVLNWHKQWGTKLRTKNSDGSPISVPRFNGWKFTNYGINFFIDPIASEKAGKEVLLKDGERIQYAMSALISIMVDNGNNPLSAKQGLNKHATGMAANMLALGINPNTILLLLNHPTIAAAYEKGLNKTSPKQKGPYKILQDIYDKFKKSNKNKFEDSLKIMVTDEMMRRHANYLDQYKEEKKVGTREELPEGMELQEMAIIREWLNIADIKSYNDNIIGVSQLQSGMGRDLDATRNTQLNIDDLFIFDNKGDINSKANYEKTFVPFEYKFVKDITNPKGLVGTNLRLFNQFSKKILPKLLITASKPFKRISDVIIANLSQMSFDAKQVAEGKVRKDLLSYLTIKAYMNHLTLLGEQGLEGLRSLNNALIYDQIGDKNSLRINKVVADIRKELDQKGIQNKFINEYISNQKVNTKVNQSGYNRIKPMPFVKLTPHQKTRIISSFLELLKFPNSKASVKHLIHYNMVVHGLQKRGTSFVDIIPPILLDTYLQEAKRVKDLLSREDIESGSYVSTFGMTLEELGEDFLRWFESSDDSHYVPKRKMKKVSRVKSLTKEHNITSTVANPTRRVLENPVNQNKLYVISDSMEQDGISELEGLRDYPNVFSIPVKVANGEYFTDEMYDKAIEEIDKAILEIENNLENKLSIVFPLNGIGYGPYYKLNNNPKAKEIWDYLNNKLKKKFGYNNKTRSFKAVKGQTVEIGLDKKSIEKLEEDKKTTILKNETVAEGIGLSVGETKFVKFNNKYYKVKNTGLKDVEDAGGIDTMLEKEGFKSINNIPEKDATKDIMDFFTEGKKMFVYTIEKTTDKPKTEEVETSASVDQGGRATGSMVMTDSPIDGNKFIIDVNKGAKDDKTIFKNGKRIKVKLSKWKKDGVRWANASAIESAGWEYLSLPELNMRLIKFVPHFAVEVYDEKTKKSVLRFYKLDKIYTPYTKGNASTTTSIFDVDSSADVLYGTRAEYKEYFPLYSKKQWKGGFMFSVDQTDGKTQEVTYNEIVKQRKEAKKSRSQGYTVPDLDNLGEPDHAPKNPTPRETTPITNTKIDRADATSDGIGYTDKEGNDLGNTSSDAIENIKSKNLVPPKTATLKGGKFLESKAEGQEASISKESMQPEGGNQTSDYSALEEWWFNTDLNKVKKAAEGMNLEGASLKDFIKAFDKAKEFTTLQRFIERIKDCY
jgi:hypothetical protein